MHSCLQSVTASAVRTMFHAFPPLCRRDRGTRPRPGGWGGGWVRLDEAGLSAPARQLMWGVEGGAVCSSVVRARVHAH